MAAAALVANGDYASVKTPSAGRQAAVYSEVQNSRLDHPLPLPSVLKNSFKVVDGPPSSAAGNPGIHIYVHKLQGACSVYFTECRHLVIWLLKLFTMTV